MCNQTEHWIEFWNWILTPAKIAKTDFDISPGPYNEKLNRQDHYLDLPAAKRDLFSLLQNPNVLHNWYKNFKFQRVLGIISLEKYNAFLIKQIGISSWNVLLFKENAIITLDFLMSKTFLINHEVWGFIKNYFVSAKISCLLKKSELNDQIGKYYLPIDVIESVMQRHTSSCINSCFTCPIF